MTSVRASINNDGEAAPLLGRPQLGFFSHTPITQCIRGTEAAVIRAKDSIALKASSAQRSVLETLANHKETIVANFANHQEIFAIAGDISAKTYKEILCTLDMLGIPMTAAFVAGAFPDTFAEVYPLLIALSIALCAAQLAIHSGAARKMEFTIHGHTIKLEDILHYVTGAITGANTFNFTLALVVAIVILALAIVQGVSLGDVYVSNSMFYGALVLPCALVGLSHTTLDLTKQIWDKPDSKVASSLDVLHKIVKTLFNAGNINSFMNLVGLKEAGDAVKPWDRVGLFGIAFGVGLAFTLVSANIPASEKHIDIVMATLCALSYLASILSLASRELLGAELTNTFMGAFGAMAMTSLCMNIFIPPAANLTPAHASALQQHSLLRAQATDSRSGPDLEANILQPN